MVRAWFAAAVLAAWVAAPTSVKADGRALYDRNCAACHGKDGTGKTKMGRKLGVPDFTDAAVQNAITDEQIAKYIRKTMPKLSESEVCELVHVVRAFGGRSASCHPAPRRPSRLPSK